LLQLHARGGRFDKENIGKAPFLRQGTVTRQDDASFSIGLPYQVGIGNVGLVNGVVPQNPQPAGQAPEHGVGDEAGFLV
jgi:hypothetical protein